MIRRRTGDSSSSWATLKPSAVANLSAVLFGIAIWLALFLGSPCAHGAVAKQSGRGTDARQTKGTPTIAATPERVEVTAASGSTEIGWNTGNGSTGFVFVTANGREPVLVARNLLLGLAAFICVDGVVFHTRLYTSILAPDSYAGRMAVITRAEKHRASSGLKEVLVLGDSRMAEGFSAAVANELSSVAGLKFVNVAEPACAVNIWHYVLREVDPTGRRYWAIVVPYGIGFEIGRAHV